MPVLPGPVAGELVKGLRMPAVGATLLPLPVRHPVDRQYLCLARHGSCPPYEPTIELTIPHHPQHHRPGHLAPGNLPLADRLGPLLDLRALLLGLAEQPAPAYRAR